MKSFLILLVTVLSSFAYSEQKNPQIRNCRELGGRFLVANTSQDEVGLCKFNKAIVGSLDLMLFENKESISQALDSYMKDVKNCEVNGQVTSITFVGSSNHLQVCTYSDSSFIELETLVKGQGSPDNAKLNYVLGL